MISTKLRRILFKFKVYRKRSLLLILFILILCSLHFILNYSSLTTLQARLNSKYTSQLTSLFQSKYRPTSDSLNNYNEDSKKYWQYYGYADYTTTVDQKVLSNILKVDGDQLQELKSIHQDLLENFMTESNSLYKNYVQLLQNYYDKDSNGIVFVSGKAYYWLTIISIKYIRTELKDDTPIEIFVPHYDKKDQYCNKMSMVFKDVYCSYFDKYLPRKLVNSLEGYQYKSLALLLSRFTHNLYLDSDNIPIMKPSLLFESEKYETHGMIVWPDFWKRSTNPKFYDIAGLKSLTDVIASTPSVESGQMLINKKTHLKTLLLSYYYNLYGPEYFYPLFSQGFPGEGDKETFYLASRVTGDGSFLPSGIKTKICGVLDSKNVFAGQAILQINPSDFTKYAFFHCNYPKLQINELDKTYYTDKSTGSKRRAWQVIRGARKENENNVGLTSLKQTLNMDLELKVWEMMRLLVKKDFKGFRLFENIGNDEMGDIILDRINFLKFD